MKVNNINPVLFKTGQVVTKPTTNVKEQTDIKELNSVMPDYAVIKPQKYTKTGVIELQNGLKLHSYKLANGHKITIVPMENSPATVKNYVNVGSMNETDDIKGISHFLEHMAFNGTLGSEGYEKLSQGDSFSKIEKLGGWTNASTSFAVTDYVNSTPLLDDADLEVQIKLIAAMTEDLALTDEMIEKEKGPVCSEINMILDNPNTIVMDQTVRTLFNVKSSADELVGGSVEHIKNLTREKVKEYYEKYYTPDNMNLVITGDVNPDEVIELVAKNFRSNKVRRGPIYEEKLTTLAKTVRKDFISDKTESADITIGFAGPASNNSKDKILLTILSEYLNSNEAGIAKEMRALNAGYYEMGWEKVSTNPNNPMLVCYGVDCSEENAEKVLKILLTRLANLEKPSEKYLEIIKERLLQQHQSVLENSGAVNNAVGNSILINNIDFLQNFESILESITVDDVESFIKKYLNINKAAIIVMHPNTTPEDIKTNYDKVNNVNFKGSNRLPVNTSKVTELTLDNNYKVGVQMTKNDNFCLDLSLNYDLRGQNFNPAAIKILNEIYKMGTLSKNEDELQKYEEENNLGCIVMVGTEGLMAICNSGSKNKLKSIDLLNELLHNPRLTQKSFDKAVERINDSLGRTQDSAYDLYLDFESKNNSLILTKESIKKGLETVTLDEVKKLHDYIMKNSYGSIVFNIPEKQSESMDNILANLNNFDEVIEFNHKMLEVYVPNEKPVVIAKPRNISQADIKQTYKYEVSRTKKEKVLENILNTILTSSNNIGLFNTLREKEHLAYSVYSDVDSIGNSGELSCNILTTTDNKEIGEISYDNVQKSINGFHRQINALLNSEYSDEDLENAKRSYKAKLLKKEGIMPKIIAVKAGLYREDGIEFQNELFKIIDSVTRDDVQEFARKVFANPPVYTIVASQDTLDANKEYFEKLEQA